MRYNITMMKNTKIAIIGGGASGLFCATLCSRKITDVVVVERGDRLGKKLSSTGNGQGNVTNVNFGVEHYFTFHSADRRKMESVLNHANDQDMISFLESLGGLFEADDRGRVYPTGRQASAVTDLLRFQLEEKGVGARLSTKVVEIKREKNGFVLTLETPDGQEKLFAETVVLASGGKAAKNFGTDGSAYELARTFSHTVTPLYPALVQIKTETKDIKTLKGIRAYSALVRAYDKHTLLKEVQGDVIFTEYGVSGDAIFRLSSYLTEIAEQGNASLSIDLLPNVTLDKLKEVLRQKSATGKPYGELLCGILNNQVGRAVMKRVNDLESAAEMAKNFTLAVTGTLGFDYAQVTKGGIPLSETDESLQSNYQKDLYFIGEILDVDGECGGYNLQWAYSSAKTVADAILQKESKARGQV